MGRLQNMEINRKWKMPNSKTFKIKAIRNLILKYVRPDMTILDPYANECSIKDYLQDCKYISNDLDTQYKTDYHLEAQDFLKLFQDNSVDLILNDPAYSPRQVSECYKKLNKTVTWKDTSSEYYTRAKKEIQRILKPNDVVITCGWNSNGIGNKYGFEKIEILLVAHGGQHNDTIVTVERKL